MNALEKVVKKGMALAEGGFDETETIQQALATLQTVKNQFFQLFLQKNVHIFSLMFSSFSHFIFKFFAIFTLLIRRCWAWTSKPQMLKFP